MASHLEGCPQCRSRLAAYRSLSPGAPVLEADNAETETARERVWLRLSQSGISASPEEGLWRAARPLWRRTIPLPLPLAAAAAAAIIFLFIALVRFQSARSGENQDFLISGNALQEETRLPVSGIQGVLRYLGDQNEGDFMIIRLPETTRFMSTGEPTYLRAADYSGAGGDFQPLPAGPRRSGSPR